MMSFATDPDAASPPGPAPSETTMTTYGTPSHSDLAAVAATVSVVGVLMALLITWLVLRLRHAQSTSTSTPLAARCSTSNASYIFRPSFAPSETSSKFGFGTYSPHHPTVSDADLPQLESPCTSRTDAKTAAGILQTLIPPRRALSSPSAHRRISTVLRRCRLCPHTSRVRTARAHTRTS